MKRCGCYWHLALALVAMGGCAPTNGGVRKSTNTSSKAGIEEAVSAYRSAGLPWVASDLAKPSTSTDSFGAAEIVRELGRRVDAAGIAQLRPEVRVHIVKQEFANAERKLKPIASSLDLAAVILELPQADFRWDWDQGARLSQPELEALSSGFLAYTLRAELRMFQGKTSEALRDFDCALRLIRYAHQAPGALAQSKVVSLSREFLSVLCNSVNPSSKSVPPELKRLVDELPRYDLQSVIRSEAYVYVATLRNMDQYPIDLQAGSSAEALKPVVARKLRRDGYPTDELALSALARGLEFYTGASAVLSSGPEVTADSKSSLERHVKSVEAQQEREWAIVKVMAKTLSEAVRSSEAHEARRAVGHLALSILSWTRANGGFPKNQASLPIRTDPFSRKPLLVMKEPFGFQVYSVGPNGRDDGGKRVEGSDDVSIFVRL